MQRKNNLRFTAELEKIEEQINVLSKNIEEEEKNLQSLPLRLDRLASLFEISERLVSMTNFDEIIDFFIHSVSQIFPQADNILFFVLQESEKLILVRSFKKEPIVIKEKEADLIDRWVLKNNYAIVVEDLSEDYRFNYTQLVAFRERKILSLISSPISVGEKSLGVLRVESKTKNAFLSEDLRILQSICDLVAIILDRANLIIKTEELATKDSLTFLFLRDYFSKRLTEELNKAKLTNRKVGLMLLDIDDFKKINDTYGHIVGDIVLKRLANILTTTTTTPEDFAARFGGEEFILCITECNNKEDLINTAEKLRKNIETAMINFRRQTINFTVSIGVVLYPDDATELESLIDLADKLLYKAKKEGKNRVCFIG